MGLCMKLLLTIRTVKYLRLSQVFFKCYYSFFKPNLKFTVGTPVIKLPSKIGWPVYKVCSTVDAELFNFFGRSAVIKDDWNLEYLDKIWLYNLHYQDDLNAVCSRPAVSSRLVEYWIACNPPLSGNGWEPYCISLRVVNWIKFFTGMRAGRVPTKWVRSLETQCSVLEQQLEYHLLANHLFANAKALVFAGVFFSGSRGERWLSKGLSILDRQIVEQFCEDGGHFELSPMYHATLLWDLADLINLAQSVDIFELRHRIAVLKNTFIDGMVWLESMVHPDCDISFFNDSTLGIAPTIADLRAYGAFLNIEVPCFKLHRKVSIRHFADSGYGVIDWPDSARCIADVGMVGPDYQPGHAHADTLSCELSLFGQRVLVNSGISQYGENAERNRQRSTAAHNTVEVDGENSSEVWAGFRVARRAYPLDVEYSETEDCIRLAASHSGFRRLKGKVTHSRTWEARYFQLRVTDRLDGQYERALGFWHLHPNIRVSLRDKSTVDLALPSGQTAVLSIAGAELALEDTTWHPGFGKSVPNTRIVFKFSSPTVVTEVCWSND